MEKLYEEICRVNRSKPLNELKEILSKNISQRAQSSNYENQRKINLQVPLIEKTDDIRTPEFSSYQSGISYLPNREHITDEILEENIMESQEKVNHDNSEEDNLYYSESSVNETPNPLDKKNYLKDLTFGGQFSQVARENSSDFMEKFNQNYENFEKRINGQLNEVLKKIEDYEIRLIKQEEKGIDFDKISDISICDKIKGCDEFEKLKSDVLKECEMRWNDIEKKEKNKCKLLEELGIEVENFRENLKDMDAKVDKVDVDVKNQLNAFKSSLMSKNELKDIRELFKSTKDQLQNLTVECSSIQDLAGKVNKIDKKCDKAAKQFSNVSIIQEEFNAKLKSLQDSLTTHNSEINKTGIYFQKLQKELFLRLGNIESKIIDLESSKHEINILADNFEKRFTISDEKIHKKFNDFEQLISSLKSSELNLEDRLQSLEDKKAQIDELKEELSKTLKQFHINDDSVEELEIMKTEKESNFKRSSIKDPFSPDISFSNGDSQIMSERLDKIEKIIIHKRAINSFQSPVPTTRPNFRSPKQDDLTEYLPGEAESLVMNAILQNTNREKFYDTEQLKLKSSSLSSFSPRATDNFPSLELKESLRIRGFNIR